MSVRVLNRVPCACRPLVLCQRVEIVIILLRVLSENRMVEAAVAAVDKRFGMTALMWACVFNCKPVGDGTPAPPPPEDAPRCVLQFCAWRFCVPLTPGRTPWLSSPDHLRHR